MPEGLLLKRLTVALFLNLPAGLAGQELANSEINDNQVTGVENFIRAVSGKRIVLLGEFTHGSHEVNVTKNHLIQILHDSLGFNVLLFESGIGELLAANEGRNEMSTRQMVNAGLFGPWRTQEYVELMEYIQKNKSLEIGGYDVQKSGSAFIELLIQMSNEDGVQFESDISDLSGRNQNLTQGMRMHDLDSSMITEQIDLLQLYDQLEDEMSSNRSALLQSGYKPGTIEAVTVTLQNRRAYLEYYLEFKRSKNYSKRFSARDSVMALNVIWFATNVYAGEKIIISGHNYHIARSNENESVMGEFLDSLYGEDMYALGIFGGQGNYANNSGKPETTDSLRLNNDIKHLAVEAEGPVTFYNLSGTTRLDAKWISEPVVVNDSFLDLEGSNKLVLGDAFDGIVVIKTISMPVR